VKKPPASVTLTVEEGEALMGRVHASGLGAADGQVVEWVTRLHFWLMLAVQEAKLRLKRFRLVPYQRRATHAGPCSVEVQGGNVPTQDGFLNRYILTSGGFRGAMTRSTTSFGGMGPPHAAHDLREEMQKRPSTC
jgi:hypothetical protein